MENSIDIIQQERQDVEEASNDVVVNGPKEKRSLPTVASSNIVDDPKETRVYLQQSKKRAKYWDHFKEYNTRAGLRRAECIHCEKTFASDSNNNGCKNIKRHSEKCQKHPDRENEKETQSKLVLQPIEGSLGEGKLKNWVMSQKDVREALLRMIILDELPFRFVEKPGFKAFLRAAVPLFNVPSRRTIKRDLHVLYGNERQKLKDMLKKSCQRVSLTTDTWTSMQRINYMCVTAHFIDDEWTLHKRILNFCPILSHKGEAIGTALEDSLISWDLSSKLFTVTVDNASSNDVACQYLRRMVNAKGGISDGNYLHMRCIAHIINLVVGDGLKEYCQAVTRIRAAVKYVRSSPSRLQKFKDCAAQLKIEYTTSLVLDVATRWNSTYLMLESALKYEHVFGRLNLYRDSDFLDSDKAGAPEYDDWKVASRLVIFLNKFYNVTIKVSSSLSVTSNKALFDIAGALTAVNAELEDSDGEFNAMAKKMREKYDKYWGNVEKMNMLMYVAIILDPRMKITAVEVALDSMYEEYECQAVMEKVKRTMNELFKEYKNMYGSSSEPLSAPSDVLCMPSKSRDDDGVNILYARLKRKRTGSSDSGPRAKSELDRYLSQDVCEEECNDVLKWWRLSEHRFPVLAHMARDVLAMPVSTVASESAFSTGGRQLDAFRSSLTTKSVEALICSQDWLRATMRDSSGEISMEEDIDEQEEFEKDLEKEMAKMAM